MKTTTPTEAFAKLKSEGHESTLLLFKVGDFYEAFGDDAETVSKTLGLTLTERRDLKSGETLARSGFPYYLLEDYLQKLIASGNQVAVIEQADYPKAKTSK